MPGTWLNSVVGQTEKLAKGYRMILMKLFIALLITLGFVSVPVQESTASAHVSHSPDIDYWETEEFRNAVFERARADFDALYNSYDEHAVRVRSDAAREFDRLYNSYVLVRSIDRNGNTRETLRNRNTGTFIYSRKAK